MLCIKKRDEWTDGRTDGRTNNPEAICPSNFLEVGGINTIGPCDHLLQLITPPALSNGKFHERLQSGYCMKTA